MIENNQFGNLIGNNDSENLDFECTQCTQPIQQNDNTNLFSPIEETDDFSLQSYDNVWGTLRRNSHGIGLFNEEVIKLFHRFKNEQKDTYSIGRNQNCDIIISGDDRRISSTHCLIYCDYSQARLRVFLEDRSVNGTFVNNSLTRLTKCERVELKSGDEIYILNPRYVDHTNRSTVFMFVNMRDRQFDKREIRVNQVNNSEISRINSSPHIEDFYIIGDLIGSGTSGQVHICIERSTRKQYAVKIIDTKKFALNPGLSPSELREEAEMLRLLDHPHIIKVKDAFETDHILFIVTELLRGGDLFDRIVEKGRYSEESAKKVMINILGAVSYLHSNDIIHRDLKPENILLVDLNSDVDVKITDFGLAKKTNKEGLKTFCGTAQYFAPEVLKRKNSTRGMGRYGAAADMWSLGVILYILLSGSFPFEEDRLFDQIEGAQYSLSGAEWLHISDGAKHLIRRLLTLRPEQRIQVKQALEHPWLHDRPLPSRDNIKSTAFSSTGSTASATAAAVTDSKSKPVRNKNESRKKTSSSVRQAQTTSLLPVVENNDSFRPSPRGSSIFAESDDMSHHPQGSHIGVVTAEVDIHSYRSSHSQSHSQMQDYQFEVPSSQDRTKLRTVFWSNKPFIIGQRNQSVSVICSASLSSDSDPAFGSLDESTPVVPQSSFQPALLTTRSTSLFNAVVKRLPTNSSNLNDTSLSSSLYKLDCNKNPDSDIKCEAEKTEVNGITKAKRKGTGAGGGRGKKRAGTGKTVPEVECKELSDDNIEEYSSGDEKKKKKQGAHEQPPLPTIESREDQEIIRIDIDDRDVLTGVAVLPPPSKDLNVNKSRRSSTSSAPNKKAVTTTDHKKVFSLEDAWKLHGTSATDAPVPSVVRDAKVPEDVSKTHHVDGQKSLLSTVLQNCGNYSINNDQPQILVNSEGQAESGEVEVVSITSAHFAKAQDTSSNNNQSCTGVASGSASTRACGKRKLRVPTTSLIDLFKSKPNG